MPERLNVHFETTGPDGDERFVREYVLDAIERLPAETECDGIGFVPASHKRGVDGLVIVTITGGVESVVAHERDRWDALLEDGLIVDWNRGETGEELVAHWGEHGSELRARLDTVAARMSRHVFEEFDTPPHPVDEYPAEQRESPTGVGWWSLLHALSIHQGYRYEDEVHAYTEGIRDAVHHITHYEGTDVAHSTIDDVVDRLESLHDELDEEQPE